MKGKTVERRTVSPRQAAEMYDLSVGTLANLRCQKRGPRYFVLGNSSGKKRKVVYFIEDIEAWIKSNPVQTMDSRN